MVSHLIVGLGNPGTVYAKTRHNVGFMVIEELCTRQGKKLEAGKGDYEFAMSVLGTQSIILGRPCTYMNESGMAVSDMVHRFAIPLQELLIVIDDFSLPLGTLRLRGNGSDGGHNGLRSIIYHLTSDEFPRLRCGIGKPEMPLKEERADFVLSPFDVHEREIVNDMVVRAANAAECFVHSGLQPTMNIHNA